MVAKFGFEVANASNDGQQFIDRIIAKMIARGMCGPAFGGHFHFKTAFVTTIHVHLGRFANDNEIRFDLRINFNECVGRDAVTPFFHVAKIVGGPAFEQTEVTRNCETVNHAGRTILLVTCAARVENAVFYFSDKRIPFPFAWVTDTDSVNM